MQDTVTKLTAQTRHIKESLLEEAFFKHGYTRKWLLDNPAKTLVNSQRLLNGTVDRYFVDGKHLFDLYIETVPDDGTYCTRHMLRIQHVGE